MQSDRQRRRQREKDKARTEAMTREGLGARDMRRQGTLTFNDRARRAAVEKAARWTAEQAERLGYLPDEILAAIRRGWTAEEVEALAVAEADRLEGPPHAAAMARIKAAPVLPIRLSPFERRCHDNFVNRTRAA